MPARRCAEAAIYAVFRYLLQLGYMQFKRMRYTKIEVECLLLSIIPTERALKKSSVNGK